MFYNTGWQPFRCPCPSIYDGSTVQPPRTDSPDAALTNREYRKLAASFAHFGAGGASCCAGTAGAWRTWFEPSVAVSRFERPFSGFRDPASASGSGAARRRRSGHGARWGCGWQEPRRRVELIGLPSTALQDCKNIRFCAMAARKPNSTRKYRISVEPEVRTQPPMIPRTTVRGHPMDTLQPTRPPCTLEHASHQTVT